MVEFKVIMMVLMTWASAQLGVVVPDTLPEVVFAPPTEIACIAKGIEAEDCPSEIDPTKMYARALYNTATRIMYLPNTFDSEKYADVSILVHELVHHVQTEYRLSYLCQGALERKAYDLQAKWLDDHGHDGWQVLETELDIDRFTTFIMTMCNDRR